MVSASPSAMPRILPTSVLGLRPGGFIDQGLTNHLVVP